MKEYLKMSDVFDCEVESDADLMLSDSLGNIADFSGYKTQCRYAAHAINSHDELVAEVERLTKECNQLTSQPFEADAMVNEMQEIIDNQ